MTRKTIYILVFTIILILLVGAWFFFFRSTGVLHSLTTNGFGTAPNLITINQTSSTQTVTNQPIVENGAGTVQKIFKISDGPVIGATIIETLHPTTTLARFMLQENGHTYDIPLDVPGAILRTISDTTIPGSRNIEWAKGGKGVLLQYVDNQTIKTVYIGFQDTISSSTESKTITYLPNNITSLAVSPDGSSVSYLLHNQNGGSNGYIAQVDGSKPKNVFSLPLSELLVTWPSINTLLVQTKSATNVPGMIFAVGTKTGSVLPLVYGPGITAAANRDYSQVLYQIRDNSVANTYVRNLLINRDISLLLAPSPERCVWGTVATTTIYCAVPASYTGPDYLDAWHKGIQNLSDSISAINYITGSAQDIAVPGSSDGGTSADIAQIIISPDNNYLLYITKGNRSLWAVRLTQ